MTGRLLTVAGASVMFLRAIQVVTVGLAAVFIVGGLLANVNILAFTALGVLALVLFGFVGVLELAARGIKSRWSV